MVTRVNDQDRDIWIIYDFNQGMHVQKLAEKYNVDRSHVVELVSSQEPVIKPKTPKPEKTTVEVVLNPDITRKLYFESKGEMMIKDAIKLILLDYLDFHFSEEDTI